ncbi:MAG: ROK family protein [Pirellulaceae bacterium]
MAKKQQDQCWIGVDLGGTKILSAVYDQEFQYLGSKRLRTQSERGCEVVIERLIRTIQEALEKTEVSVDRLAGIGIGCPGFVDMKTGLVHECVNLGWKDIHLGKTVQDHFDCPIYLLNDVDAGVYAEHRFGAASGADNVLGVFPGTGIGGGAVVQGSIVRGPKITAMEIGHVNVVEDGLPCGCGKRGCLETVASRLAIASAAASACYRGQAPYLAATTGTHVKDIRSGILAKAIEEGDQIIEEIILNACKYLGIVIANYINLLVPEVVVLGGGLVEAMPQLFVKNITRTAKQHVLPVYRDSFRVAAASLGDYATAMGAACWAAHKGQAAPFKVSQDPVTGMEN